MTITVEYMTDEDYPRAFEILSDAFKQDHEYINVVFPRHAEPDGRAIGAKRLFGMHQAQPWAHFLKGVNEKGEMIAFAKWNLFENEIPEEGGLGTKEFWDDEQTADYADALYRGYLVERRAAIRGSGGNLASLDLLIVDPKHFRKGAGRALIRWGNRKADEMGVDAVVEASDHGVPAYEAEGFRNIKQATVETPEAPAFAHRPKQKFWWMVREKKTKQ